MITARISGHEIRLKPKQFDQIVVGYVEAGAPKPIYHIESEEIPVYLVTTLEIAQ